MSYKNQILKQFVNGKYGKKTCTNLIRKKVNVIKKNNQSLVYKKPIIVGEEFVDSNNDKNEEKFQITPQSKMIPIKNSSEQTKINSDDGLINDRIKYLEEKFLEMKYYIEEINKIMNNLSIEINILKNVQ